MLDCELKIPNPKSARTGWSSSPALIASLLSSSALAAVLQALAGGDSFIAGGFSSLDGEALTGNLEYYIGDSGPGWRTV
jgi:hypothetical protein